MEIYGRSGNGSAAYDLTLFDVRGKRPQRGKIVRIVREKKEKRSRLIAARNIAVAVAVSAVIMFQVYLYSVLAEMTDEVASLKKEHAALAKEEELLNVQIENIVNMSEIEEIAQYTLYMQKASPDQIEYVNLGGDDYGEVVSREMSIASLFNIVKGALKKVTGWLNI